VNTNVIFSGHNHQVINGIIKPVLVNMVNNFVIFEESAEFFFHNKTVLKNIPCFCRARVLRLVNVAISTIVSFSSPLVVSFSSVPGGSKIRKAFSGAKKTILAHLGSGFNYVKRGFAMGTQCLFPRSKTFSRMARIEKLSLVSPLRGDGKFFKLFSATTGATYQHGHSIRNALGQVND